MRHLVLPFILLAFATTSALAQTSNQSTSLDTVTITAPKIDFGEVIRTYVESLAAPSPFLGKIARWEIGVCPKVMGLQPQAAATVVDRIKAVAKTVGAPVATGNSCRTNVEIIVTAQPQDLLDALRKKNPDLLGFSTSPSQAARMAIIKKPIQAWYVTETKDDAGIMHPDELVDDCAARTGSRLDCFTLVSGFTLSDGLKSEFVNSLIVVDSSSAGAVPIGALADYVSMVALAQTQAAEDCRALPTVTNLVSAGCPSANKSSALTQTDFAYLHALYRVQPDAPLNLQKKQIGQEMQKTLSGGGNP